MIRNSQCLPADSVIILVCQLVNARVVRDCKDNFSLQRFLGLDQLSNDTFFLAKLLPYAGSSLPHQFTFSEVVVHIYATGHILLSGLLQGGDIEPKSGSEGNNHL